MVITRNGAKTSLSPCCLLLITQEEASTKGKPWNSSHSANGELENGGGGGAGQQQLIQGLPVPQLSLLLRTTHG